MTAPTDALLLETLSLATIQASAPLDTDGEPIYRLTFDFPTQEQWTAARLMWLEYVRSLSPEDA